MNLGIKIFLMTTILSFSISGGSFSQQVIPKTMRRTSDPIQVPGELLKGLHGTRLDSMRLFAYHDGAMRQIIYQFDERLADGTYIVDLGEKANANLANHTFDPQDLLVFYIRDTGDQAPKEIWPVSDGVEIEIEDPLDGGRSYCYLLRFSEKAPERIINDSMYLKDFDPKENPDQPLVFHAEGYDVNGRVTRVKDRVYKSLLVTSFSVPESAGGSGVDFVDGMRTRFFIEFLSGAFRFDMHEGSVIGGIDQLRLGNVRGYGRNWFTVRLPVLVEGPRMYVNVFVYDRMLVTPAEFNLPFNPGTFITRAAMEMGFDLNEHAVGMRLYTPTCMDGVTIDGRMSERERAISDKWAEWYALTGPQGSIIIRIHFDPKMFKDKGRVMRMEYTDDRTVSFPPDDEPGSIGFWRNHVEFTDMEPGLYPLRYEFYFPPDFYDPEGLNMEKVTDFLNIADAPLIIRVEGISVKNQSLNPPPLNPRKKR